MSVSSKIMLKGKLFSSLKGHIISKKGREIKESDTQGIWNQLDKECGNGSGMVTSAHLRKVIKSEYNSK